MGPQKVVPQGTLGKRCLSTGWLSKTALRQFKPKSPCFADIWKNQLNQSMPAVCVRERACSTSLEVFVTPVIHSLPSRPGRAVATAPCNCCHARLRRFLSCGMIFHEQSFIPRASRTIPEAKQPCFGLSYPSHTCNAIWSPKITCAGAICPTFYR